MCQWSRRHMYLGSANVGSRSERFTKELGIFITNCPSLAEDATKLFQMYWDLDNLEELPKKYDETFPFHFLSNASFVQMATKVWFFLQCFKSIGSPQWSGWSGLQGLFGQFTHSVLCWWKTRWPEQYSDGSGHCREICVCCCGRVSALGYLQRDWVLAWTGQQIERK